MSTVLTEPGATRPANGRRTRLTGLAVGALIGTMIALVLAGTRPAAIDAGGNRVSEVEQLRGYLAGLEPIVQTGAATVVLGLRNGVADVGQSRFDDDVLTTMVHGWQAELTTLREELGMLTPPAELRDAHTALVRAMDTYVTVTVRLAAALEVSGEARLERAKDAATMGQLADDTWDQGARLIQAHAHALGESPVPWLPNNEERSS